MFKRIVSRNCIVGQGNIQLGKELRWFTHQNNWCLFLLLFGFIGQICGKSVIYKTNNNILSNIRSKDLRILDFYRKENTSIAVLANDNNNKFIIKQKLFFNSLTFALEKLGSEVAQSVNICVNQVRILPSNYSFIGKKTGLPATLHTFVPGVQIISLPKHLYKYKVCLRQVINENPCEPGQKKIWGFSRKLISFMALHEDFPKIVALDTFMANHDRQGENLFYDARIDHFFLIDFGCALRVNLAENVYRSFLEMLQDENVTFSAKEIKSLIVYRNMLKCLIKKYDPELLNAKIDEFIKQAKIAVLRTSHIEKRVIVDNYNSCIKVVHILDKLLKKISIDYMKSARK